MYGLGRLSCTNAMVLIAGACGAIALQGCGVLVPSDCAQRAVCPSERGTTTEMIHPPDLDGAVASSETQNQGAKDNARGASSGATGEAGTRAAATDGGTDASADSGGGEDAADTGLDVANIEVADDTGNDASLDGGTATGPRCFAAYGTSDFCNAGEHCCVNAATRVSNCATSCDPKSGFYAVDCAGASGDGGCGAQTCCGSIVLSGGTVPNCNASMLTSACVDSCSDDRRVPGSTGTCLGQYAIRFCTSAADCAGNPSGNTACCNFGNPPSTVNWCVAPLNTVYNYANSCL
jgi:hypothetical protein